MFRHTRTLTCRACGRRFRHTFPDAIKPQDALLLKNPVCGCCRLKRTIFPTYGKERHL